VRNFKTTLVSSEKDVGKLKSGEDVVLSNGLIIKSSEVVEPSVQGRVVAVLQDTSESLEAEVNSPIRPKVSFAFQ
jgi:hypothetical protein